jgi:hypothetical protein
MNITKEYKHSWNYSWKHMFTPTQRYSMYVVMALWAIWGIMGFGLLTTNATIEGYAFAKEVWAEYQNPHTTYEKTVVVTVKDPVKVLEWPNAKAEKGSTTKTAHSLSGLTPTRR